MAGAASSGPIASTDDAAVFRFSRKGLLIQLASALIGALILAFFSYDAAEPALRWAGLSLSASLVAVCLFFMLKPFDPAKYAEFTLTIDRVGIECGRLYTRKVPWEAISYAYVKDKQEPGSHALVVGVRDTTLYPPAAGKLERAIAMLETFGSVSMDLDPLDGTSTQVEAALKRFQPDQVGSASPGG